VKNSFLRRASERVEIESEWIGEMQERLAGLSRSRAVPLKPKEGLNGPPANQDGQHSQRN
jgi:hypothetical protein